LWTVEPGASLRTAPLPVADMVVTIDEDGTLTAVNRQDGKRRWSIGGVRYVGAPVLARGSIVAATYRGTVELIGLSGERLDQWDARTAANPADGEPGFTYGPIVGGDAIWLGDSSAVVRRLGAPPLGQIPSIEMRWIDQSSRPPFAASQLRSTVAEYDGKAIVVDLTRSVFEIDPATGSGVRLADQPGELLLTQVDPLVVGDLLLTISGRTMQALDLRTGQLRWQGIAPGTTIRPPAVVGDRVLWVNTAEGQGSLLALDLASGAMRWNVPLGGVSHVGGVAVTADQAFTNTPPAAFDLATGAQLWRSPVPGAMFGGPIVGPDGHTVYMGGVNATQTAGTVAALDAATGEVRWQIDLADAVMAPLDRLWAEGGLVIVPDLNGKVVALDAETGTERWRFTPPVARLGAITVDRGRVWFMLENARLYGLDLASGRPMARLTELELGLNGQGLTQRPVFVGDRLIYPAGLQLLGLDPPEEEP
jgi:outer membrane protein assembly factor BamB